MHCLESPIAGCYSAATLICSKSSLPQPKTASMRLTARAEYLSAVSIFVYVCGRHERAFVPAS
jgi:hypothetical protein